MFNMLLDGTKFIHKNLLIFHFQPLKILTIF